MLDNDRHARFNDAGKIRVFRDRFGIIKIVEAHVLASDGRELQAIRASRLTVGIEDGNVTSASVSPALRMQTVSWLVSWGACPWL